MSWSLARPDHTEPEGHMKGFFWPGPLGSYCLVLIRVKNRSKNCIFLGNNYLKRNLVILVFTGKGNCLDKCYVSKNR